MDALTLQALASLEQARQLNNCHAKIEQLQAELDRERADNQTTYCAYCGQRFQLDDSAAVLVSEHIRTCEKHPLQDAMREVWRLETENERLRESAVIEAKRVLESGKGSFVLIPADTFREIRADVERLRNDLKEALEQLYRLRDLPESHAPDALDRFDSRIGERHG